MKPAHKRAMLATALTATLLAAYFAPALPGDGASAAKLVVVPERSATPPLQPSPESTGRRSASQLDVLALESRADRDSDEDARRLFPSLQIAAAPVPPPTPAVVAASVEQLPPPLPFKYMGRYVEDGQVVIFLQYGEQNVTAHVADTIGERYRVDEIEPGGLLFTYVPLGVQQRLELSEPSAKER